MFSVATKKKTLQSSYRSSCVKMILADGQDQRWAKRKWHVLLWSKVLANASKFYITYFKVQYNNIALKRPTYSIMLRV